MKTIRSIRGMNDILPPETSLWQYLEKQVASLLAEYGYREIRLPVIEHTELFQNSIGESTDIVEKEMYSFSDRNGDSLTLRPEGTASCVRALCQHHLAPALQKLWYQGPMFRHERPQHGRQRQFHQLGVEVFGVASAEVDAELLLLSARLWRRLGLEKRIQLQLNSLGDGESRQHYREALVSWLSAREAALDDDSRRRLRNNPLRILDSKNPQTQSLLEDAPVMADFLNEEAAAHFDRLREILDANGLVYTVNHRLVRGLDYYNRTVFEWVTEALGAQGTVCGGGRYDTLVQQFGGKATPAAGFAAGLERLVLLLQQLQQSPLEEPLADVYFTAVGDAARVCAITLAEAVRDQLDGYNILVNCEGGSFKSQLKKADKSGARLAVIIGEREVAARSAGIKPLRGESAEQFSVAQSELAARLQGLLA
ncbi:MAG: histidine--tRNA ligase [Halieaceae bacterium]|nr:histidine--tRNA ligase [Halieaceae bacterium]